MSQFRTTHRDMETALRDIVSLALVFVVKRGSLPLAHQRGDFQLWSVR